MSKVTFRAAVITDAQNIAKMLSHLADDLGDGEVFASSDETIRRYGFGNMPMFDVVLAEVDGEAVGFALYFSHFSTTKEQSGVFVQDLWVNPKLRSFGVGQKLLATVANNAAKKWNAGYMNLSVHADNPRATHFYSQIGFFANTSDVPMVLDADAFEVLKGAAI